MADASEALCDAIRRACEAAEPLRIAGSGSKAFLTRGADAQAGDAAGRLLSVAEHQGVIDHRPEELVITARAGTSLREVERVLDQAGQQLPFEPPRFHGGGTLGGAVACGLAGPGRPWWGSVRDALLGVEMVNGCGERLRFGGQVMKNVAGYDVSRLQAGAFGTLGLLLSVSLKVLPSPATQRSLVFEMSAADALARCRSWARQSLPITGTCFVDGLLRVRLSGAEAAVSEAMVQLGGALDADIGFWDTLRDHRLDFFADGGLWRCALPPAARAPLNDCLITWAGAERWWRTAGKADPAQAVIGQGGHARPFDAGYGVRIGPHLGGAGREYSARLKHAFDPGGILNPELSIMPQAAYAH